MKITASTEIFGVVGNPIRHSLSPILQNGWLKEAGYNAVYLAFEPKSEDITGAINGLYMAQIKGLNITAPFKTDAAAIAINKSPEVKQIGAANTLKQGKNGFDAYNTDGIGLVLDLDVRAAGWREKTNIITILGVGGAAKGVLHALLASGVKEIRLVGRDAARTNNIVELAKSIQNSNGTSIVGYLWNEIAAAINGATLIINATPIGLKSGDSLKLDLKGAHTQAVVYDMTYAQTESDFLKSATAQNRRALNGLGMLVGQGAYAFHTWFGQMPDFNKGLDRLSKLDR